jgi:hypothetical protein
MKSIGRVALVAVLGVVAWPAFSQAPPPSPVLVLPVLGPTPLPAPVPPTAIHPAPGPIAGAGLPVLAVGFGVYWLVKRRRRKAE